jgi:hypothetical protein
MQPSDYWSAPDYWYTHGSVKRPGGLFIVGAFGFVVSIFSLM